MRSDDQGTHEPGRRRYQAIPRTLIFVTSANPDNGAEEILLLKGAPDKRLWANKYNGLGGHVEADEDILESARRELLEETGLDVDGLQLRGVVNIETGYDDAGQRPGVIMFVFVARCDTRAVVATDEGAPEWVPVARLGDYPLVDDLYEVIPRALANGPLFFAHYRPAEDGRSITLYHVGEGESCILTASCILNTQTFPAIAEIEQDTEGLLIPEKQIHLWLKTEPCWQQYIFSLLSQRMEDLIRLVDALAFRHLDVRLAKWLLEQSSHQLAIRTTHQTIAEELASSREVISRLLKEFERDQLIKLGRGVIEIVDRDTMNKII